MKLRPNIIPHQSKVSVQPIPEVTSERGLSMLNEELRRIQLKINEKPSVIQEKAAIVVPPIVKDAPEATQQQQQSTQIFTNNNYAIENDKYTYPILSTDNEFVLEKRTLGYDEVVAPEKNRLNIFVNGAAVNNIRRKSKEYVNLNVELFVDAPISIDYPIGNLLLSAEKYDIRTAEPEYIFLGAVQPKVNRRTVLSILTTLSQYEAIALYLYAKNYSNKYDFSIACDGVVRVIEYA